MTSEELEKLRADLADLDARRTHDHDDPVRLAHPLVAMFDEATVRKLLAALDEATKRAEAARRMLDRMADESHVFNTILENTQQERDEARAALGTWEAWDAEHHGGVRAYVAALEADQRRLVVAEQDAARARAEAAACQQRAEKEGGR